MGHRRLSFRRYICIDCKAPLAESILAEQQPMRERALQFEQNPDLVRSIIAEGVKKHALKPARR